MISLEDCVGLSGLTEEEVLAIAEHVHIPSALGQYLSRQERGIEQFGYDRARHSAGTTGPG